MTTSTCSVKPRYHLLDALRGFLFLNMVAYHFLYDWVFLFNQSCPFMFTSWAYLWQQMICSTFILLSGISWNLSRFPQKNGLLLLLSGFAITLGTLFITPSEVIHYGILSFLGSAYLLTGITKTWLVKTNYIWSMLISASLFILCKRLPYGALGILDLELWPLPSWLYQAQFTYWLGFPHASFYSSDYFPLLPWIFLYLAGIFGGRLLLTQPQFLKIAAFQIPVLQYIGKHTLLLYLLHQPVLFLLLNLYFH